MSTLPIANLFTNDRLPSGLEFMLFISYAPFGICFVCIRFFIGFHAYLINILLPKCSIYREIIMRVLCSVLGIVVRVKSDNGVTSGPRTNSRMIIANYTSSLDHLAIDLVIPNVLPSVWDLPPILMYFLGYKDMETKKGRQYLINNAFIHIRSMDSLPLLAFPEGGSTNGDAGLLKFSVWPFSLNEPVQPLLVKLHRPFLTGLAPSILGGRWWMDIFWFLFVPVTFFDITFAPIKTQFADESCDEFTSRMQKFMGSELNLMPTSHTSNDKVEYAKRILFTGPENSPRSVATVVHSGSQDKMVASIQSVLPNVPIDTIIKDLAKTKDVELTLSNLLEGRVLYTPIEIIDPIVTSKSTDSVDIISADAKGTCNMIKISAKHFQKNSCQRHLSLQERKHILFENARKRFVEKFGEQKKR